MKKIAIVEPDAAQNNTAFQAQAKTYEFLAQEYGWKFAISAAALGPEDKRNESIVMATDIRKGEKY